MASKTISTILNLKDNFSETIKKTTANTAAFTKGVKQSESTVSQMKSGITSAFSSIGESIKDGIGIGAGLDIWEGMKSGFSEMTTFGSDLQKSLNEIQTATGYNNEAMSDMKEVMTSIYNDNFGENFEDIAETIKTIGQQTGSTGDDLKGLAEDALLIRDAFDFDVKESVRSASMMMNQFGLTGDQAYNLIAQGAQYGLDKNDDLLDSINEYSVHFKQLGFNADDMFNMLVNGAAGGTFSVDKLGDAVKEFGIRSKDGSKSTMEAFQGLGLDANKLSQQFAQGGDVGKQAFNEVNQKLLGLKDPLKQNQIGVALWGSMWEDLGVTGITALTDTQGEISNTYDALNDINNIQYNDIGSAFEGIKRNLQTSVLLPISDAVLPKLNEFASWFSSNVPGITEKVSGVVEPFIDISSSIIAQDLPALKDLADAGINLADTVLGSVKPAFDAVVPDNWNSVGDAIEDILKGATDVFNFINDNWPEIEPVILTIVGALAAYKLALMAIETWTIIVGATTSIYGAIELAIWGVANATTAWEAAQWLLNVAMDANPVGIVIGALALLGLAIYEVVTHWEEIYNWMLWVWDVINNNPIADFITDCIPFVGLLKEIVKHWDDITNAISKAWDWLTSWNNTDAADKDLTVTEHRETVTGGAAVTVNSDNNDDVGFNATGTQYWKGGKTWVGEHGKELIDLPSGSKVYTASQSKNMSSGNGGLIFNINFTGNVGTKEFFDQAGEHIINEIELALANM